MIATVFIPEFIIILSRDRFIPYVLVKVSYNVSHKYSEPTSSVFLHKSEE